MRAIRIDLRVLSAVVGLSIAAMPVLVNGQDKSLSVVNKDNSSNDGVLKDSVKETKRDFSTFVDVLMKSGVDTKVGPNMAPTLGLPKALPAKNRALSNFPKAEKGEMRTCSLVYEKDSGSTDPTNRPFCVLLMRSKRSGLDNQVRYYRVSLDGILEKVVVTRGKYDADGNPVRGSGVKFDEDINSPEVKKAFDAEMKFWLKDWLKKEQKAAAKPASPPAAAPR